MRLGSFLKLAMQLSRKAFDGKRRHWRNHNGSIVVVKALSRREDRYWLMARHAEASAKAGYQLLGGGLLPTDLGPPTSDLQRSCGQLSCGQLPLDRVAVDGRGIPTVSFLP